MERSIWALDSLHGSHLALERGNNLGVGRIIQSQRVQHVDDASGHPAVAAPPERSRHVTAGLDVIQVAEEARLAVLQARLMRHELQKRLGFAVLAAQRDRKSVV